MNSNLLKLLALCFVAINLAACSMLDHRDFADEMSEYNNEDPSFIPNVDFPVMAGDTGEIGSNLDIIRRRTPASRREKKMTDHELSIRGELQSLEGNLDESEQRRYIQYKDKLGNDSQKIYYLSLDARQQFQYLKTRGFINEQKNQYYTQGERAIASLTNDVVLGMHKSEVSRVWGEPARVDFAGDKREENERWAYRRNEKVKFIYFNAGIVEGWTEE